MSSNGTEYLDLATEEEKRAFIVEHGTEEYEKLHQEWVNAGSYQRLTPEVASAASERYADGKMREMEKVRYISAFGYDAYKTMTEDAQR